MNASTAGTSAQRIIVLLSRVSGKSSARFLGVHRVRSQETLMRSSETDCEAERWASKDMCGWYESLPKGPTRPGSSDHVVEIRRSPNFNRESLEVTCREVMFQSSEPVSCYPIYLPITDKSPSNETICAWSERDILLEHRTTFGGRIEQCLVSYKRVFHKTYVSNGKPRCSSFRSERRLTQMFSQEDCRLQRRKRLCSCTG